MLAEAGFEVRYTGHLFILILPFLFARAKLRLYSHELKIHRLPNAFFQILCRMEYNLFVKTKFRSPIGGTVFSVAGKR